MTLSIVLIYIAVWVWFAQKATRLLIAQDVKDFPGMGLDEIERLGYAAVGFLVGLLWPAALCVWLLRQVVA